MKPLRMGNDAKPTSLIPLLSFIMLTLLALVAPAHAESPLIGPRLEARGSAFELLGIVKGNTISFYRDDLTPKEPIHKAKFEIDTGDKARKLNLRESEPGLYWD